MKEIVLSRGTNKTCDVDLWYDIRGMLFGFKVRVIVFLDVNSHYTADLVFHKFRQ